MYIYMYVWVYICKLPFIPKGLGIQNTGALWVRIYDPLLYDPLLIVMIPSRRHLVIV